jgi:hypothetical protein
MTNMKLIMAKALYAARKSIDTELHNVKSDINQKKERKQMIKYEEQKSKQRATRERELAKYKADIAAARKKGREIAEFGEIGYLKHHYIDEQIKKIKPTKQTKKTYRSVKRVARSAARSAPARRAIRAIEPHKTSRKQNMAGEKYVGFAVTQPSFGKSKLASFGRMKKVSFR